MIDTTLFASSESRPSRSSHAGATEECELTSAAFVISLDLELFWGMRDQRTLAAYGRTILGGRAVIPALLDLFAARQISATWATVGFLFCADKEELLSCLPRIRPEYRDTRLSPYTDITSIGSDEKQDPYHFGQSLVRRIHAYEDQEIGTHTFSHFYCMEVGGTPECLRADLQAAKKVARTLGIDLKSVVFPRNQAARGHLHIARDLGFKAFRGNQRVWFHRASEEAKQSYSKRAARLADTYVPVAGHHVYKPQVVEGMVEVVASRFLRPVRGGPLDAVQLARIRAEMIRAAKTKTVFHLWWHPHDFGRNTEPNLAFLKQVLDCFVQLRDRFGMQSFTMGALAKKAWNALRPEPISRERMAPTMSPAGLSR